MQINKAAWERLPPEYKAAFEAACAETYLKIQAEYDIKNSESLVTIRNDKNIVIRRFSSEIINVARAHTDSLLEQYADQDEVFRYAYTEWKAFKSRIQGWSEFTRLSNYQTPG